MEAALIAFIVIGVAMVMLSLRCCWVIMKIWTVPPSSVAQERDPSEDRDDRQVQFAEWTNAVT